jgi:hypothetical protein
MEPEGSIPHSQVPATCPYPEPDRSSPSNLLSVFRSLGRTRVSVQVRGFLFKRFVTGYVLRWGVVSTSPNTQAGVPHLVGCPRLPIHYIRSYPPYWRPFPHPQPEDAPCCGDRDPLITDILRNHMLKIWFPGYMTDLLILGLRTLSTIPNYSASLVIKSELSDVTWKICGLF